MCDGEEVNIYDGQTSKIKVSEKDVLKGWRCPHKKLWRIPLQAQVTDLNLYTLILNRPTGHESLNYLYPVPSSAAVLEHIELFNKYTARLASYETIHNVYRLQSIDCSV